MAELSWCGKYAVGVEAIDDEHKELFNAVQAIESAMARNADPAEMDVLLKVLPAVTFEHFAGEEAMMRAVKYPGVVLHAANHQRLMEKVEAFSARYSHGGVAVNQYALNFLRDWLLYHIENDDARFGVWWSERKTG